MRRTFVGLLAAAAVAVAAAPTPAHAFALRTVSADVQSPGPIVAGHHGAMWFLTDDETGRESWRGLDRIDARGTVVRFGDRLPAGLSVRFIAPAGDGGVWLVGSRSGDFVHVAPDGVVTAVPFTGDVEDIRAMGTGADGRPWVLTTRDTPRHELELVHIEAGGHEVHATIEDGPSDAWSQNTVVLGRDGRMWVAGHFLVSSVTARGKVTTHPTRDAIRAVGALTPARGGGVVFSTAGSGLWIQRAMGPPRRLAGLARATRAATDWVGPIAYAASGRLWTFGKAVTELRPGGRAQVFPLPASGLIDDPPPVVMDVVADHDGALWLTTSTKVVRLVEHPACQVPNVVDRSPGTARRHLAAGGCRAVVRAGKDRGDGPVRVVAQSVKTDRVLRHGARVVVTTARVHVNCRYDRKRWSILGSTPAAVVAFRSTRTNAYDSGWVSVCDPVSGRQTTAEQWKVDTYAGVGGLGPVATAGHWVAVVRVGGLDASTDSWRTSTVTVVDVTTGASRQVIDDPELPTNDSSGTTASVDAVAVDAIGDVAWTSQRQASSFGDVWPRPAPSKAVHIEPVDGPPRTLARSPKAAFAGLALEGGTVRWTQDGVAASAPVLAAR